MKWCRRSLLLKGSLRLDQSSSETVCLDGIDLSSVDRRKTTSLYRLVRIVGWAFLGHKEPQQKRVMLFFFSLNLHKSLRYLLRRERKYVQTFLEPLRMKWFEDDPVDGMALFIDDV